MELKTVGKWIGMPVVFGLGIAFASLWPRHEAQAMPAGEGSGKYALFTGDVSTAKGAAPVTMKINSETGESWVLSSSHSSTDFLEHGGRNPSWIPVNR